MQTPIIVLLGLVVATVYSQTADDALFINPPGCGRRPMIDDEKSDVSLGKERIVGGPTARAGDWGWQVIIYDTNNWQDNLFKFMGGQIINSGWVLTAAHFQEYMGNDKPPKYGIYMLA
jgi:hypothetical protein